MKTNHDAEDAQVTAGANLSYWIESVQEQQPPLNPLNSNIETEVVIVGGGLAGISVAYCLLKAGKKIVLVEDGYLGSGETGRTTAHLVTALDDRYYNIENLYGKKNTRLIAESHRAAIDFIETIALQENIACGFERVNGYLFPHPSDKKENLEKELKAVQDAGIVAEELELVPGMRYPTTKCIRFANQAQFHPMQYLLGLAKAIEKMGGLIFTGTHAKEITHKGIVAENGFEVKAQHVVVATNSPVNNKYTMHMKQFPYRTYVIGALISKGEMGHALWWDTGDFEVNSKIPPYHYARLQAYNDTHDLLICGGEDHATGLPNDFPEEKRYKVLEEWARLRFPISMIKYRWSGQVLEPMDSLAYIGRNPWDRENVYIVTGDSGNGMTHCTIAGILITDLITGKENKWESIYRPSRVKLFKAGGTWFKEFAGGLIGYLKDTPDDADSITLASIKPGEGKIVELRKDTYGVYRDEQQQLHLVSATCTHLGCTVKWNNDEKSWDCPCHGSRFTYDGKILNGPANVELNAFSEQEEAVDTHL